MSVADHSSNGSHAKVTVRELFDELYAPPERYWWRKENRHETSPEAFPDSVITRETLRCIGRDGIPQDGRALDLGAGEGADAIRLALLGYRVTAVEISEMGRQKILRFAREANVTIDVIREDVNRYEPVGKFDVVLCNGVLQYIEEKAPVIERMQEATRPGGINVVSVWSTFSPVPGPHQRVPVFCDDEDGIVTKSYSGWEQEFLRFDRLKPETAHPTEHAHVHSHIKLIARKPADQWPPVDEGRQPG